MSSPRLLFCAAIFASFSHHFERRKAIRFRLHARKTAEAGRAGRIRHPNHARPGKFTFTGSETIKLNVRKPVRQLVLNALEIKITSASLDGKAIPQSALKLDPKQETLTITLASELPQGPHTLELEFTGQDQSAGPGTLLRAVSGSRAPARRKIMLGTQVRSDGCAPLLPVLG